MFHVDRGRSGADCVQINADCVQTACRLRVDRRHGCGLNRGKHHMGVRAMVRVRRFALSSFLTRGAGVDVSIHRTWSEAVDTQQNVLAFSKKC